MKLIIRVSHVTSETFSAIAHQSFKAPDEQNSSWEMTDQLKSTMAKFNKAEVKRFGFQ